MRDKNEKYHDKIRGCLVGGAVGDALGYAVEFMDENYIYSMYGQNGITEYDLSRANGTAIISDDTQMSMFTANGILVASTKSALTGKGVSPDKYVQLSYQDWLRTQQMSYAESKNCIHEFNKESPIYDIHDFDQEYNQKCDNISWLSDVPAVFFRRAPGNTCMSALIAQKKNRPDPKMCIDDPVNNSKGCGGIMRVAPLGLKYYKNASEETLDREAAILAAITHGHSLGYMPATVLVHIIRDIVFKETSLKDAIIDARDMVCEMFTADKHISELRNIINLAIELSENDSSDVENIHRIGEGWVAEETLGIALYCALKYQNNFSSAIIASVNHNGDSDSTGAVTGNILGALHGYESIEDKWKKHLELREVILELADDIYQDSQMETAEEYQNPEWTRKYVDMKWG